ncbi:MAG: hypothetical protein PHT94_04185 [Candidatus Nanoarchaeia archaeon]|nr:hypothetical protein [Candidatus Nanoarchaeia archaeon]
MGKIISSKRIDKGLVYEVELDLEEGLAIGNYYDNIHLFSEKKMDDCNQIATRGKNCGTKYFLIPKNLRSELNLNSMVSCQRINFKDKYAFIYIVDKKED